jgi:hypothetical protein
MFLVGPRSEIRHRRTGRRSLAHRSSQSHCSERSSRHQSPGSFERRRSGFSSETERPSRKLARHRSEDDDEFDGSERSHSGFPSPAECPSREPPCQHADANAEHHGHRRNGKAQTPQRSPERFGSIISYHSSNAGPCSGPAAFTRTTAKTKERTSKVAKPPLVRQFRRIQTKRRTQKARANLTESVFQCIVDKRRQGNSSLSCCLRRKNKHVRIWKARAAFHRARCCRLPVEALHP